MIGTATVLESLAFARVAGSGLVDGDPVASAVRRFMETHTGPWSGLMSKLHDKVTELVEQNGRRPSGWPGDARWFGDKLRRAAPSLQDVGIHVSERRRASGMEITLTKVPTSGATDTLATLATLHRTDRATSLTGANVASVANVANGALRPTKD